MELYFYSFQVWTKNFGRMVTLGDGQIMLLYHEANIEGLRNKLLNMLQENWNENQPGNSVDDFVLHVLAFNRLY